MTKLSVSGYLQLFTKKAYSIVKTNADALATFINAHNFYQEEWCDGVDYIFDVTNKNDIKCLLDCGLDVDGMFGLYAKFKVGDTTQYFNCVTNYKTTMPFNTTKDVAAFIVNFIEELMKDVLTRPFTCVAYIELYKLIVSSEYKKEE